MNCPKCNGILEANSKFCHYCGTKLQVQPTYQQPQVTTQPMYQQQTSNTQINQSTYQYQTTQVQNNQNSIQKEPSPFDSINRMSEEEELMRAYIGKNNDTLYSNGGTRFNIWALLFDEAYFLYRKMWGWFFIRLIGTFIVGIVVSMFMEDISWLGSAISLLFAFIFNSIYTETVRKRVTKIKNKNPDKTREELVAICKMKGGTSILAVIIYIGSILLIGALIIAAIIFFASAMITELNRPIEKEPYEEKFIKVGDISFAESKDLTIEINTDTQYKATYISEDPELYCVISAEINENPMCHTTNTCFETLPQPEWTISEQKLLMINGKNWNWRNSVKDERNTYGKYQNKQEFYIENNGKIYTITYDTTTRGTRECINAFQKLKSTLKVNN